MIKEKRKKKERRINVKEKESIKKLKNATRFKLQCRG
jgi:hypothetical protein